MPGWIRSGMPETTGAQMARRAVVGVVAPVFRQVISRRGRQERPAAPCGVGVIPGCGPSDPRQRRVWRGEPATVSVRRAGAAVHASAEVTEQGTGIGRSSWWRASNVGCAEPADRSIHHLRMYKSSLARARCCGCGSRRGGPRSRVALSAPVQLFRPPRPGRNPGRAEEIARGADRARSIRGGRVRGGGQRPRRPSAAG